MDDTYRINVAKTTFREAYNNGDVDQLLSVFEDQGFVDLSEGSISFYGEEAVEGLRNRSAALFAEYAVRLTVIVNEIVVLGDIAYDHGWHEFTFRPKNGGEPIRKRHRYLEMWKKNSFGDWKIAVFMDNADVRMEMAGLTSHWFLSEERSEQHGGFRGS